MQSTGITVRHGRHEIFPHQDAVKIEATPVSPAATPVHTHMLIISASFSQQLSVCPAGQLVAQVGLLCAFRAIRLPSFFTTVMPAILPSLTCVSKLRGWARSGTRIEMFRSCGVGLAAFRALVDDAQSVAAIRAATASTLLVELFICLVSFSQSSAFRSGIPLFKAEAGGESYHRPGYFYGRHRVAG